MKRHVDHVRSLHPHQKDAERLLSWKQWHKMFGIDLKDNRPSEHLMRVATERYEENVRRIL